MKTLNLFIILLSLVLCIFAKNIETTDNEEIVSEEDLNELQETWILFAQAFDVPIKYAIEDFNNISTNSTFATEDSLVIKAIIKDINDQIDIADDSTELTSEGTQELYRRQYERPRDISDLEWNCFVESADKTFNPKHLIKAIKNLHSAYKKGKLALLKQLKKVGTKSIKTVPIAWVYRYIKCLIKHR